MSKVKASQLWAVATDYEGSWGGALVEFLGLPPEDKEKWIALATHNAKAKVVTMEDIQQKSGEPPTMAAIVEGLEGKVPMDVVLGIKQQSVGGDTFSKEEVVELHGYVYEIMKSAGQVSVAFRGGRDVSKDPNGPFITAIREAATDLQALMNLVDPTNTTEVFQPKHEDAKDE